MTQFKVDTVQMRQIADEVQHIHWEMERIEARLDSMMLNHLLQFRGGAKMATTISGCRIACGNQSNNLKNLYKGLESVTELYKDCENGLKEPKDSKTAQAEAGNWVGELGWKILTGLNGPLTIAGGVYSLLTGDFLGAGKGISKGTASLLKAFTVAENGKVTCDWAKMFGFTMNDKTFTESLRSTWDDFFPGSNANGFQIGTSVAKWAGVALSFIGSGISNYDEFEGEMGGRYWAETLMEGALDVGKGILVGAGVAAAFTAAIGGAPAILVAGATVAVTWGADKICEAITGKNVTELVSDAILDTGERIIDDIADGLETVGEAIGNAGRAISNGAQALWNGFSNAFAW